MAGLEGKQRYPVAKALGFAALAAAWVALDLWTKSFFASAEPGALLGSALGGLVDFKLVHNTGAAWGVFAGNPLALGLFSLAVCALLVAYFLWSIRSVGALQLIGMALVVAGGIGNAVDRFAQGYVVDFIAVTFIDFPVFNVADIGVTCGVVVFMAGLLVSWRSSGRETR